MSPMDKAIILLEEKLPNSIVKTMDLTGTQDHVGLLVVSDEFEGKMLLAQHRLVMDILKEEFKQDLHAVQIKTMTHEKYNESNSAR